MKTTIIVLSILCLSIISTVAQQKQSIDIKSSIVNWTGHAEIGSYAPTGTLKFINGEVIFKKGVVAAAVLTIDMKSMQQSNPDLLAHLKSPDFFDVEKYPVSKIMISSVSDSKAYGQLTIKDKTLPIITNVNVEMNSGITTITGKIVIDRTK